MLLQSLLRPVLTPLMRGMFDAPIASSSTWSPLALWPDGIATPGMWISPRDLTSQWQDYIGTTPVSVPGTVADSSNPVGLALDIRAGATVLTDPGNHMLQSTSTSRPLLSARVNLLTYTEDFSGWYVEGGVLTATSPPEGIASATKYTFTTSGSVRVFDGVVAATVPNTYSILARAGTGFTYLNIRFENSPSNVGICVNLLTGAITTGHYDGVFPSTAPSASDAVEYGDGWWRIEITNSSFGMTFLYPSNNADSTNGAYTAGDYFEFTALQLNLGTTATDYQAILTDGSTYPSTGFPIAQKYDGVDDGMATAAFAAGTLIDGMDCMIVVRRDSAAATYLISNTGSRGFFEWESGDTNRPDVSAGTPTYYVDGVACTATRGALFTALTAGDWHILEARGLDLSTWTAFDVSKLASYCLNGARGDILLYPSTTPTADKDAARQWLADYYGVTLP